MSNIYKLKHSLNAAFEPVLNIIIRVYVLVTSEHKL